MAQSARDIGSELDFGLSIQDETWDGAANNEGDGVNFFPDGEQGFLSGVAVVQTMDGDSADEVVFFVEQSDDDDDDDPYTPLEDRNGDRFEVQVDGASGMGRIDITMAQFSGYLRVVADEDASTVDTNIDLNALLVLGGATVVPVE